MSESQLWVVAIKGDRNARELTAATKELASVYDFKVPSAQLRVGTLDSLMSLSDDLQKMDLLAEGTVTKMYKQLTELKDEEPTIIGVPVTTYTTMQWEWDEAKFQLKAPLRELVETINLRIGSLDDELKVKVSEVNSLKVSLQAIERKTQGNLMVRGMGDIVGEGDVLESDYMTTLFVVVPKTSMKEFEHGYHKMAAYVVPKSGKLLAEDMEYGLYAVVIFKKSLEEFKASAREKRLTLREYTYSAGAAQAEAAKKDADSHEYERLKGMLANWCYINYAEVYTMMVHLKAVRVFVESVLRYGLVSTYGGMAPNFKSFLVLPKKGQAEKLRKAMGELYAGGASAMAGDGEEEAAVPGATGEFYPYVYTSIETQPQLA